MQMVHSKNSLDINSTAARRKHVWQKPVELNLQACNELNTESIKANKKKICREIGPEWLTENITSLFFNMIFSTSCFWDGVGSFQAFFLRDLFHGFFSTGFHRRSFLHGAN